VDYVPSVQATATLTVTAKETRDVLKEEVLIMPDLKMFLVAHGVLIVILSGLMTMITVSCPFPNLVLLIMLVSAMAHRTNAVFVRVTAIPTQTVRAI